jgi:predicted DCC family thiol-disulfide oxidoreductase YuxK
MNDKPVILFDGVCNLCNSSVQFILKRDKESGKKAGLVKTKPALDRKNVFLNLKS